MGQIQRKEMCLLFNPADHHHRLAEVSLGMTRSVGQRHKHLSTAAPMFTDIGLDRRVAALEPVLVTQPLKNTLGRMPLLAVPVEILLQPLVDEARECIQPGPLDLSRSLISGRDRKAHHLLHARPRYPKMARRFAFAHATPTRKANLQIQIHD